MIDWRQSEIDACAPTDTPSNVYDSDYECGRYIGQLEMKVIRLHVLATHLLRDLCESQAEAESLRHKLQEAFQCSNA